MAENEDIPYNVSEFATPEDDKRPDDDQPNKSILVDVSKFLEECLEHDRTMDALDLSKDAPLSLEQQVFIAKRDNTRLMSVKQLIDNKIKELV